jgi:hypothetical protein
VFAGTNAMVEGPTWNAWWTANSYGPSYMAMPFMMEPLLTWHNNSQNFWRVPRFYMLNYSIHRFSCKQVQ